MKKKILLIGPSPHNIGGISVHLKRLIYLMNQECIFDVVDEGHERYEGTYNLRSLNLYTYFKKVVNADIVHIHSGSFILRLFHIIICKIIFRKLTIVTVHRDPHREGKTLITKFFLHLCDKIIMVNREGYELVKTNTVDKYYLLPAFLPPIFELEPMLPTTVELWINNVKKDKSSVLLASNAFNLVLNQGQDLYGLDLCIEMMKNFIEKGYSHYYLIFVVASNTKQQMLMKQYKKQINDYGVNQKLLIWEEPLSFVKLVEKSDIILRTTNTDGDALSVREALFLKKKVIASDIVDRPKGTILFKNRDVNDLCKVVVQTSKNTASESKILVDYKQIYSNIYNIQS